MSKASTIREQVRRNAVALISLVIAITSLGYNTWRNEVSEHNRNQRLVAIELLVLLGQFDQALLDKRYAGSGDNVNATNRRGWALVRTINDLAMVAAGDVPDAAQALFNAWSERTGDLRRSDDRGKAAEQAIKDALADVRRATHEVLRSLE